MQMQFNLKNPDEGEVRAYIQKLSRQYKLNDIGYGVQKSEKNSITVSREIDADKDNSKDMNDLDEPTNKERQVTETIGLKVAGKFMKDDPEAKLRLFIGQEHKLLEKEALSNALAHHKRNKMDLMHKDNTKTIKPDALVAA